MKWFAGGHRAELQAETVALTDGTVPVTVDASRSIRFVRTNLYHIPVEGEGREAIVPAPADEAAWVAKMLGMLIALDDRKTIRGQDIVLSRSAHQIALLHGEPLPSRKTA